MTIVSSKIIGEAPNVQWGGETDNSGIAQAGSAGIAVVVGAFKRGKIDDVFYVTSENVTARLGSDPENLSFQAVLTALRAGARRVYVRRIRGAIISGAIMP